MPTSPLEGHEVGPPSGAAHRLRLDATIIRRLAPAPASRRPAPLASGMTLPQEQAAPTLAGGRGQTGGIVIGGDHQGLGIVRSLGRRGMPVCVIDDEASIARAPGFRSTPSASQTSGMSHRPSTRSTLYGACTGSRVGCCSRPATRRRRACLQPLLPGPVVPGADSRLGHDPACLGQARDLPPGAAARHPDARYGEAAASMTVWRRRQHPSGFGRASTYVETVELASDQARHRRAERGR
jgi:hypothetical protein